MIESIDYLEENLKEELKRADHLIHVTLKYTRTVDVLKNIIKRLMNVFNLGILQLLQYQKDNKKIDLIPKSPVGRIELAEKLFDKEIKDYIKFYNLLKMIDKAEYTKKEEFRKNVAMIVKDKKPIEINIEVIKQYYDKAKNFADLVEEKTR